MGGEEGWKFNKIQNDTGTGVKANRAQPLAIDLNAPERTKSHGNFAARVQLNFSL